MDIICTRCREPWHTGYVLAIRELADTLGNDIGGLAGCVADFGLL